jgi:hypothetical protein
LAKRENILLLSNTEPGRIASKSRSTVWLCRLFVRCGSLAVAARLTDGNGVTENTLRQ